MKNHSIFFSFTFEKWINIMGHTLKQTCTKINRIASGNILGKANILKMRVNNV